VQSLAIASISDPTYVPVASIDNAASGTGETDGTTISTANQTSGDDKDSTTISTDIQKDNET